MRLAYMGTPEFAVPALEALAGAGHEIAAIYTQPPRPAHRGRAPTPSAVEGAARAMGLEVRTPVSLREAHEQARWRALGLEVAVVAAYGLILPGAILEAPARGCLNIHASLLPRWRGAAPIQRAILAGDAETGVTIMGMERGLDTGPMLLREATPVGAKTAGALTRELAEMGARLIVETLAGLDAIRPEPQPEDGVTYAAKIDKAEARLDFARPAVELERAVRAFNPAPGAYFLVGDERVRVLEAEVVEEAVGPPGMVLDEALTITCGVGALRPLVLQRAGRGAMAADALLRGFPIAVGSRLG